MTTAIDLFSGAGGLSLGLHAAGISTVFAVEIMPDAAATYRSLFPNAGLHQADVRSVDFRTFNGVDLVVGGPPCQPFSSGGLRLGDQDLRDFLPEFVRAVLEVRPRAFLMENVPGLAKFEDYLRHVLAPLEGLYTIGQPTVVNAADFGVPQSRRRLVIVGTRDGVPFQLPTGRPDHPLPAGAVLRSAPFGEPNLSKVVYAKRPDLRPNPYHGHLFNGGGRAINLDKPAPTILAAAGGNKTHFLDTMNLIPEYHRHLMLGGEPCSGELPGARRITVAESAALQSFPPWVTFAGRRSSQYTQVGNAVPPRLAQVIGEALDEQVLRSRRKRVAA